MFSDIPFTKSSCSSCLCVDSTNNSLEVEIYRYLISGGQTGRWKDRQVEVQTYRDLDIQADRQTSETYRQTGRRTGRQTQTVALLVPRLAMAMAWHTLRTWVGPAAGRGER